MKKYTSFMFKKYQLQLIVVLTLVAAFTIMFAIYPGGVSVAELGGSSIERLAADDHDDGYEKEDGEIPWRDFVDVMPNGQEIIPVYGEDTFTTGTNDFAIGVSRAKDKNGEYHWYAEGEILKDIDGYEYDKDIHGSIRNFLIFALEKEWELRIPIPPEIEGKIKKDKVSVGIALAYAEECGGGTDAKKLYDYINSHDELDLFTTMPSDPRMAREFLNGTKNKKRGNLTLGDLIAPTIGELFDLDKGPLQYKLAGEFLYLKGWPRINIVTDYYYEQIYGDMSFIGFPIAKKNFGGNGHYIHSKQGNLIGSNSTLVYELDSLVNEKFMAEQTQDEFDDWLAILQADRDRANGAGFIHLSQIKNAAGELRITQTSKEKGEIKEKAYDFWFMSWKDGFGVPRHHIKNAVNKDIIEDEYRIGVDGIKDGTGISLWFFFPLQLTFYVLPAEDVSVEEIEIGENRPSSKATITVLVANRGKEDKETKLVFSVNDKAVETREKIELKAPTEKDEDGNFIITPIPITFDYIMPEGGFIKFTAEINPEPRDFEEIDYTNNVRNHIAMVDEEEGDLPYGVYSRDIQFITTPYSIAELTLPSLPDAAWTGIAYGDFYVKNSTPTFYTSFSDRTYTYGNYGSIKGNAHITATIHRKCFEDGDLDDPVGGEHYAKNLSNRVKGSGLIESYGPAYEGYSYTYTWECSNPDHDTHSETRYGTKSADPPGFENIYYGPTYTASVYNGLDEDELIKDDFITEKVIKNYTDFIQDKQYVYELAWEGTHYNIPVIRYMSHMDLNGNLTWLNEYMAPGKVERTFIGQSSGTITWKVTKNMPSFYGPDRQNARAGKTGKGSPGAENYKYAVFATDKKYQSDDYPYPIKSGYYFNPVGTYTCEVKTTQYKDNSGFTKEHEDLVKAVREAFFYDSKLEYVDANQKSQKLEHITQTSKFIVPVPKPCEKKQSPLHAIPEGYNYNMGKINEVDGLLKEVMEGYEESLAGKDSFEWYRYREFNYDFNKKKVKEIWKVEETTVITFPVEVPNKQKIYTDVRMKNGDYRVQAAVDKIEIDFEDYIDYKNCICEEGHNTKLVMDAFTLEGIIVTVQGSMYDDRQIR